MGLIVNVFRSDYHSDLCVFAEVDAVTVVNLDGPFDPSPERPAARLVNRGGNLVIIPIGEDGIDVLMSEVAFGGSYGASSDSRFGEKVPFYGAVPIHDYALNLEGPGGYD